MELYELTTAGKVRPKERFALIGPEGEVLTWYKADHGDSSGMWVLEVGSEKWSWFVASKLVLRPLRQTK
jgi:hypothetical protein